MNHHQSGGSRRNFIKKASIGSAMALSFSHIAAEAFAENKTAKITLRQGDVLLFQGDSITDAGRNREEKGFNNTRGLGTGYALLAGSKLLQVHADKNLQIYNRGISGNKVYQLAERWDADCLDLKPAVLSILIGVNDFWHKLNGEYSGTVETYRNDLKKLLDTTKEKLQGVRLVIGEPFAVSGVKAVDSKWFPEFTEFQLASRELATQYKAVFIPYQSVFDKAAKIAPPAYWTSDGVHTTLAGSQLMAEALTNVFS